MSRCLLLLALWTAGCAAPVYPSTHLWGADSPPVVVGTPLTVVGGWSETCTKGWLEKNGPHDEACHPKRVQIEVACQGPCKIEDGKPIKIDDQTAMVRVIAVDVGTVTIHAKNMRVGTSAVQDKSFSVNVVPPQRLALECLSPRDSSPRNFVLCGPDGVSAQTPVVRARIYVGDREADSMLLAVNGAITPVERARGVPELSLAQLFPEARQGDGVSPGTYTITLALAGVTQRFEVVAR